MARIKGSFTVFPASAGVILETNTSAPDSFGLSRVSGGDPGLYVLSKTTMTSFPRQRG